MIIGNLSGGVRNAARIGGPVVSVTCHYPDEMGMAQELTQCPQVREVGLEMSAVEVGGFADVARELPLLRYVIMRVSTELTCEEVQGVVTDAALCGTAGGPSRIFS